MNICSRLAVVLAVSAAVSCPAASPVSSGSRDALFVSDGIEGWSLGIDASMISRGASIAGFPDTLEADTYGAFLGWRGVRWLTLYTVLGQGDAQSPCMPARCSPRSTARSPPMA